MTTYANKLRALADYLEAHEELHERISNYENPSVSLWYETFEEFQQAARKLGGYKKGGYGGELNARHVMSDPDADEYDAKYMHLYQVSVHVSDVCEKVAKIDEETGEQVLRPKRVYVDTGEMEPEYEWKCPVVWSPTAD